MSLARGRLIISRGRVMFYTRWARNEPGPLGAPLRKSLRVRSVGRGLEQPWEVSSFW
jgi:hypothetical protein